MWTVVPSPKVEFQNAITGISHSDVWVAGNSYNGQSERTVTEHWNGSVWTVVPSPNASKKNDNGLAGITDSSASDVWTVGDYLAKPGSLTYDTLIEHWNGQAWTIVASLSPGNLFNLLEGVSSISPSDAWAVGYYYSNPDLIDKILTEHWDGHAWTVVPTFNFRNGNALLAVSAHTPSDVWAVGWFTIGSLKHTLTEHWNGHKWTVIPSPQPPGNADNDLTGISIISPSDIWVVGNSVKRGNIWNTITEHWNGHMWTLVPSPNLGRQFNGLFGVSAISSTDVWAGGGYLGTDNRYHALIERWKC